MARVWKDLRHILMSLLLILAISVVVFPDIHADLVTCIAIPWRKTW